MQVCHASGRYSRPYAALVKDVLHWTGLASIVTFTEVADPERAKALVRKGWTTIHGSGPGEGECAIMVKDSEWVVVDQGFIQLTEGGGKARLTHPMQAPWVLLHHRTLHLALIVSTAHTPAHIEGHLGKPTPQWRAWFAAVKAWDAGIAQVEAEHPHAEVLLTADWNLNANRAVIAKLIGAQFPDHYSLVFPKAGTEGVRAIDGAVTTLLPGREPVVLSPDASDHKAVLIHVRPHNRTKRKHKL
jgi:hypothetical protein